MDKQYQKVQKQVGMGALCASLLIGLPATAAPRLPMHQLLSQTNPKPGIFKEPPYSRPPSPASPVLQPPLPEQQPPSAVVAPKNGTVTVTLINETGAEINYQVIGNTNQRRLEGRSNVLLQNLPTPVTLTFRRRDGGLLKVTPQASSEPGMLEVRFAETTDLGVDRTALIIQRTGGVFLN